MISDHASLAGTMDHEGEFGGRNCTRLFYRWSRPPTVRGLAVVAHGMLEHSGRYAPLRDALREAGLLFYAWDHRGHGRSSGPRGDVSRFEDYVDDLSLFCGQVREREPGVPFFVIGHSMGGLVSARYAIRQPTFLDGVVLSSTPAMLGSGTPPLRIMLTRAVARLLPTLRVDPRIDPTRLSHDPAVIEAYRTDRLVLKKVTTRFARELVDASRDLVRRARAIRVPVLILHGTEDAIADVKGVDPLFESIGSKDKTRFVFDGLRHELFNEMVADRALVLEKLVSWLSDRIEQSRDGRPGP